LDKHYFDKLMINLKEHSMLDFVKKVFREFLGAILWINLILCAIAGGVIGNLLAYNARGGAVFLGLLIGAAVGLLINIASGGFIATILNKDGSISGNSAGNGGGGVYMGSGTFAMSGGVIGGNTASYGGGVCMQLGTFTKSAGAVIYGSNAPEQANSAGSDSGGHAVYANGKKRNTTARAATVMDSTKDGPSGGWE
jgi:hypothetical protein